MGDPNHDDTITVEDAAAGYKGLLVIERCFRALKRTRIKMEPMYHCCLAGFLKRMSMLCDFALLIERVAELRANSPGPGSTEA